MGALDPDGVEIRVLDVDIRPAPDLITLDLILGLDRVAARGIDELTFDPVAGGAVDGMEADTGGRTGRGVQSDRT